MFAKWRQMTISHHQVYSCCEKQYSGRKSAMEWRCECQRNALIWLTPHDTRSVARWMQQSRKPTDDWIKIKYLLTSALSLSPNRTNSNAISFHLSYSHHVCVSAFISAIRSVRSQSKLDLLTHCHLYKFTAPILLSRETETKRKSARHSKRRLLRLNEITWRVSFFTEPYRNIDYYLR